MSDNNYLTISNILFDDLQQTGHHIFNKSDFFAVVKDNIDKPSLKRSREDTPYPDEKPSKRSSSLNIIIPDEKNDIINDEELTDLIDNIINQRKPKTRKIKSPCPNDNCDHSILKDNEKPKSYPEVTINTLDDLIALGKTYHCKQHQTINDLDLKIVAKVIKPLEKLNKMIGMQKVKRSILDQIIYFLLGFNKQETKDPKTGKNVLLNSDMLHTVISGPPGCGKTELGKLMGEIYKELGVLSNGKVHIKKRADFIGKYLGHTAIKTQSAIDEAIGGVLFIDEAYSLGHKDKRDSFSKECLDVLNMNLSERRDFLCIIAGYKESLETDFFSMNPGLKRRFSFWHDIYGYSPEELCDIFLLKINDSGWKFEAECEDDTSEQDRLKNILISFFETNISSFPYYGGDVETFLMKCKIVHSRRILTKPKDEHKIITIEDINNAFIYMKKN